MIFEVRERRAEPVHSEWELLELELERYLVSAVDKDSRASLLDAKVFGEPLLLLENQVLTKQRKRADLLALDQFGNAVFVELKRGAARQGVETQALQYLANYANVKGERFLARFAASKEAIDAFLGDYDRHSLNQKSRIMLVARSFDESVLSLGEWLATQGVAFRCIEYVPFRVADRTFLSFSVRFDRSRDPIYQLSWESRPPQSFWHNIGVSPLAKNDHDRESQEKWWRFQWKHELITASFENESGDAGDQLLNSYVEGDRVLAYASGFGAIGWGIVEAPSYDLVARSADDFAKTGQHRHRLKGIRWKYVAENFSEVLSAKELKESFKLHHPIQTKSRIPNATADAVIAWMNQHFKKVG